MEITNPYYRDIQWYLGLCFDFLAKILINTITNGNRLINVHISNTYY